MGYAVYEDTDAARKGVTRWAGYAVPAICDMPDCQQPIDRGLGYKCEPRRDVPEDSCGLYFCVDHHGYSCPDWHDTLTPKPDTPEWEHHMLTDDSWARWRTENPVRTAAMRGRAR